MATATEAPASSTAEGQTQHVPNQLNDLLGRLEQRLEQADQATFGYTREERAAALHKLREPFDRREIRYRPQPWCKACTGQSSWPKVCGNHTEIRCQKCNNQKVTEAHICLAYIGHAEATNRLLNVDPFWNWEPLALDQVGLPQYDGNRAMWIKLTVCGVTRIGYGDAQGKDGANAVKEIIGDAIRNAGMRFGMALNLWTSSDLQILEPGVELTPELAAELGGPTRADRESAARPQAVRSAQRGGPAPAAPPSDDKAAHLNRLMSQAKDGWNNGLVLVQVQGDADKNGVLDQQVQGPDQTWMPFRQLLSDRILALKATTSTERNAA
ncbi:hypothetical protein [Streptomyces sp. t39]|uniref:hypothetical protein n=1 Tax=Streptomyces sp. t39 TaxID=1828156 RepID=UPI0011CE0120|nr:hypothetical protein [Streptomyces sp. t39]TXS51640.1 hypothetical protein EAO77_27800 [Streptomyces sp. t39]